MRFVRPTVLGVLVCIIAAIAGCSAPTSRADLHSSAVATSETLVLTSPADRIVYQRGFDNAATLRIVGSGAFPGAALEARLCPVTSLGVVDFRSRRWQSLGTARSDGTFDTSLREKAGWYRLEVRAASRRRTAMARVDRVGIGEVFIVVGHSVAHGGRTNLAGAMDDRASTIAWPPYSEAARKDYEQTADPRFLPPLIGTHFTNEVVPGPFGHGTYFWAQAAERIARAQDVPVLMLNAAFGGTSLEHWAKSARGERFEHSFVKSELRMPYINLRHALLRYAKVTGVRAILADHGQNDWPEPDARKVFTNYVTWVDQARQDLGFSELAVVVNRASPPGDKPAIRRAQERMIREVPHCFPGPDYDTFVKADRYDGVHLSETGMDGAARLWAAALNDSFFQRVTPYQPPRQ